MTYKHMRGDAAYQWTRSRTSWLRINISDSSNCYKLSEQNLPTPTAG